MAREVLIPSTMVESPGANRTISAADRAASVHPCTAIPTLAFFKAGASLTPSPDENDVKFKFYHIVNYI
jgi:hypothetical protein